MSNVICFACLVAFKVRVPIESLLDSLIPSTVIDPVYAEYNTIPALALTLDLF